MSWSEVYLQMMKLVYYASLLGGEMDTPEMQFREKEHYTILKKSVQEFIQSESLCLLQLSYGSHGVYYNFPIVVIVFITTFLS